MRPGTSPLVGGPSAEGVAGSLPDVMSEQLLTILKFCLMALLYLFFFRVLRAVTVEINPPPALERAGGGGGRVPAEAAAGRGSRRQAKRRITQLTVVQPEAQRGRVFPVSDEMTVGRAGGCTVPIPDDTYASQIHARIFGRDGQTWVEDLGSTNGTFVNDGRIASATAVRRGDRVRVGGTVMELG